MPERVTQSWNTPCQKYCVNSEFGDKLAYDENYCVNHAAVFEGLRMSDRFTKSGNVYRVFVMAGKNQYIGKKSCIDNSVMFNGLRMTDKVTKSENICRGFMAYAENDCVNISMFDGLRIPDRVTKYENMHRVTGKIHNPVTFEGLRMPDGFTKSENDCRGFIRLAENIPAMFGRIQND